MGVVLVLVGVVVLSAIGFVVALFLMEPSAPSAHHTSASSDCAHADLAFRRWDSVYPDISEAMIPKEPVDITSLSTDVANAASAVRREAAQIEDQDLKAEVTKLASQLDLISEGNPISPPNGWPDKNYMGGYQGAISTIGELKKACPDLGD